MRVRDVMTKETSFCGPDASLAEAAECMRKNIVEFLPAVGEGGNVIESSLIAISASPSGPGVEDLPRGRSRT